MKNILEIHNMTLVKAGHKILDIPFFSVSVGEVASIMGPNGAGKTSLLQVMASLETPTSGTIMLFGQNACHYEPVGLRRRMAMVFQEPILLDASVSENVELGLKFRQVVKPVRQKQVKLWLEKLKIAHLASRSARSLSGGEAQRVSLARALVLEPEIVFLDEPFSNLDKDIKKEFIADLGNVLRATHTTAVLVTHRRSEALALADVIYYLESGKIARSAVVKAERSKIGKIRKK